MKDACDDGGGPAGVVDGLSPKNEKVMPFFEFLSGVDGAGLESGTIKRCAIATVLLLRQTNVDSISLDGAQIQ